MLRKWNFCRCEKTSSIPRFSATLSLFAFVVIVSPGCGGKPPAKPAATQGTSVASNKAVAAKAVDQDDSSEDTGMSKKTASGKSVRKSVRGIPYDAFFDNPLGELENTAVVASAAAPKKEGAEMATDAAAKPTAEATKPAASGGGTGWGDLVTIDMVQEEAKKARNHLNSKMTSLKEFNDVTGWTEIAIDGAVLAALGGIALEHGEAASWKANAHYIRDFGGQLCSASVGPGKDNYEKSKAAQEKLTAIFSGSVPADAGDVPAKRPFHEVADRNGLMKRIEKARDWMKLNINTEAKFKSDADAVLHESMVILAFGKVIATEGYTSADEEEYQKFAEALLNGAKEVHSAVKDQSFDKFTKALDKVNKSCTDCHSSYGTG